MGQLELGDICLHPVRTIDGRTEMFRYLLGTGARAYTVGWEHTLVE